MSRESDVLRLEIKRLRQALAHAAAVPLTIDVSASDWRRGYQDGWLASSRVTAKYATSVLESRHGVMLAKGGAIPASDVRVRYVPVAENAAGA